MMVAPQSPARNRYRTPLPFQCPPPAEDFQQHDFIPPRTSSRPIRRNSESRSTHYTRDLTSPVSTRPVRPNLERMRSNGSVSSQAVVHADSWLPYQRPMRCADLQNLMNQLDNVSDDDDSSPSSSSLSTLQQRTTKSSNSSDPSSDGSPQKIVQQMAKISPSTQEYQQRNALPPRQPMVDKSGYKDRVRVRSTSPPKEYRQPQDMHQSIKTNSQNHPPNFPNYSRPLSPVNLDIHKPFVSPTTNIWPERDSSMLHPRSTKQTAREPQLQQRAPSVHSVQLEEVEGVRLGAVPKSAQEQRTGLNIPEIEARDIKKIPGRASQDEDFAFIPDYPRHEHYAREPPSIGGNRDGVRSISPKPVYDPRDHILLDRYCRAADDELPDQRAAGPRGRPSLDSHSNMQSSAPLDISIPEVSEDGAEPPSVPLSRGFKEQDAAMTSKTHQARSLISGMLKGFGGTNRLRRHSTSQSHSSSSSSDRRYKSSFSSVRTSPNSNTSPESERGSYGGSQMSDVDSQNGSIWSPTRLRRRSDDSFAYARKQNLFDGDDNMSIPSTVRRCSPYPAGR